MGPRGFYKCPAPKLPILIKDFIDDGAARSWIVELAADGQKIRVPRSEVEFMNGLMWMSDWLVKKMDLAVADINDNERQTCQI